MNARACIPTRYLIYKPGRDQPETVMADLPEQVALDDLQTLLGPLVGGAIEHIPILFEGKPADMFVNEFAHPEGFELNEAATAQFRAALHQISENQDEDMPVIKGTAVLFERPIYEHRSRRE